MKRIVCLLALGCVSFGCSVRSSSPETDERIEGPVELGDFGGVKRWENLHFGGQPDADDFPSIRDAGIDVVVDLRARSELAWDEEAVARAAGLVYHRVPITQVPLDPNAVERIDALIAQHEGKRILVHCRSANRVGGWFALHLAKQRGVAPATALAMARAAGLKSTKLEKSVRAAMAKK